MREKSSAEVLDYIEDYSAEMAATSPNDTISISTWTTTNGLIVDSDSKTTTTTKVWLSGGRNFTYASAVNKIVTTGGRTFERTTVFDIKPIQCD